VVHYLLTLEITKNRRIRQHRRMRYPAVCSFPKSGFRQVPASPPPYKRTIWSATMAGAVLTLMVLVIAFSGEVGWLRRC
jgi:hypothetical protein